MKRHHALLSVIVAVFLTSAIASAGIYGVVTVLQNESTFVDDAPVASGTEPEVEAAIVDDIVVDPSALLADPATPMTVAPVTAAIAPSRNYSIPVRVNRVYRGRLAPAERAEMQVIQNGQILFRDRLGQGGVVQLGQIEDGIYSLLIRGTDGFAVAHTALTEDALANQGIVYEIGLAPWVDMEVIDPILQSDVYGGATVATIGEPVAAGRWDNLVAGADFEIGGDGVVHGRVTVTAQFDGNPLAVVNARVLFVRNGQIVSEGLTDNFGEFSLTGLSSGVHSFVVASNQGCFVAACEILEGTGLAQAEGVELRFVAFDDGDGSGPSAEPAPPGDVQAGGGSGGGPLGGAPPQGGAGAGTGGGGSGGGGSGGGGGGGGLLGALLGGAAGAALGWALADDDDDDNVSP